MQAERQFDSDALILSFSLADLLPVDWREAARKSGNCKGGRVIGLD